MPRAGTPRVLLVFLHIHPLTLDQLSNQFTASVNYINLNAPVPTFSSHPVPPPPNSPPTATADRSQPNQPTLTQAQTAPPNANTNAPTSQPQNNTADEPRSPSTSFAAAQQELAQDLIRKTQQIEALIGTLPGLGRSQEAQEARIAALEEELKAVEAEWKAAVGEREEAIEVLERLIGGVRR